MDFQLYFGREPKSLEVVIFRRGASWVRIQRVLTAFGWERNCIGWSQSCIPVALTSVSGSGLACVDTRLMGPMVP